MHFAELLLILLVVGAWAGAIALFLNRWGRIRIVQQRDFSYRHKPKNLDQIKIVKRPTESVIYRNYPTNIANTLEAREKRLQRMRTMPNIKVGSKDQSNEITNDESKETGLVKHVPLVEINEEQANEGETVIIEIVK